MNERLKRVLMIAGFILVTAGLAYLLYRIFFRPAALPPAGPGAAVPTGALPSAGKGAPKPAAQVPETAGLPSAVEAPIPTLPGIPGVLPRTLILRNEITQNISGNPFGQGIRSYNPNDGKFYRVLDDGTAIPMSNQTFYNVDEVTWGKKTDQAVINFPDGSKVLFDFQSQQQTTLPKHWEDFDFSPQDDRVVVKSLGNNEDNRFLITANPDGTNGRIIEALGDNEDKVQVNWSPNNQVVAFAATGEPLGYERQELLLLGQNHENFRGLVVEGRGFVPNWSPSGNNLLYSTYQAENDYRPTLWISGASGDSVNANRRNIQLQTWADKCAWQSEASLICAVPTSLGEGAGFQRELFAGVADNIVRINASTGEVVNLGQPDGNPSIQRMILSPDGKYAYFNDAVSGRLMRFEL